MVVRKRNSDLTESDTLLAIMMVISILLTLTVIGVICWGIIKLVLWVTSK